MAPELDNGYLHNGTDLRQLPIFVVWSFAYHDKMLFRVHARQYV
jgi:hypothetical protein